MLGELLSRGGMVMYLLLGCSIVSSGIIIERFWFWLTEKRRVPMSSLHELIKGTSEKHTLQDSTPIPFLREISVLVKEKRFEKISATLRKESERAYARSIQHLSGLDTVISISPLLGILGTVLGIMKSFHALDLQHMTSPGEVGHGLAEAMITTASGLAIAVPTLVCYNLFHSLAARHASSLYKLAEDLHQTLPEDTSDEEIS